MNASSKHGCEPAGSVRSTSSERSWLAKELPPLPPLLTIKPSLISFSSWSIAGCCLSVLYLTHSMDRFLSLLAMFLLAAVSHAALSPQLVYWHSVLPNTPMPSAINVLAEEKSGVNVYTKGKSGGTTVNVGHGGVNHKG
ncbi:BURP domain-containing protein [Musa troglodytarum]|uniref:BURP domain-containing protein n=1 Tax=Musa troglodytarum TaxID=320322 RepID=A0A9E7G8D8_9LILI|nr:BURP domain-containing protein [Musa troglodytarum]